MRQFVCILQTLCGAFLFCCFIVSWSLPVGIARIVVCVRAGVLKERQFTQQKSETNSCPSKHLSSPPFKFRIFNPKIRCHFDRLGEMNASRKHVLYSLGTHFTKKNLATWQSQFTTPESLQVQDFGSIEKCFYLSK